MGLAATESSWWEARFGLPARFGGFRFGAYREWVQAVVAGTARPGAIDREQSFSIAPKLNQTPDTATLTLVTDGTWRPVAGNDILIYTGYPSILEFGGTIIKVQQTSSRGMGQIWYACSCVEWAAYQMRQRLVFASYVDTAPETIIAELLATSCAGLGYTMTHVQATGVTVTIDFNGEYVPDCIEQLAQLTGTGWAWYMDPGKDLHYFDPAVGETDAQAPAILQAGNALYDTLVWDEDVSQVRTRIWLFGKSTRVAVAAAIGATSLTVEDSSPFGAPSMAITSGESIYAKVGTQLLTYTGVASTPDRLTGIPASGAGSITKAIKVGDPVIFVLAQEDGSGAALTALAARDGTDGRRDHQFTDETIDWPQASKRCEAERALYETVPASGSYVTYDQTTRVGSLVTIDIPERGIDASYLIHAVTIGFAPGNAPRTLERKVEFATPVRRLSWADTVHSLGSRHRRRRFGITR